jgi:hypothetical protein
MRMYPFRAFIAVLAAAGAMLLAPPRAAPQPADRDPGAQRAKDDYTRLRSELERVNAEIADLKRGSRGMRGDYRLRDRMADAEALAQKLTQAEKRLRSLGIGVPAEGTAVPAPPPPVLPHDGSVELEAKADLLADRAGHLLKEANTLAGAAQQLRARSALRRRAGVWDRDPFTGLEASRRNLAITSASSEKSASPQAPAETGRSSGSNGIGLTPTSTGSAAPPPPSAGAASGPATGAPSTTSDSASKGAFPSPTGEGASTASKTSPMPAATLAIERQALDQRFFLDPTAAAELRAALGPNATLSDPEALERAATALRRRADALAAQAQALRVKSRAP